MAFGTPKGTPVAQNVVQLVIGSITVSGSAATALTYTVPTGFRAQLDIQNCFAHVTTEIAGDSTAPTFTIKKDSTAIGTITMADGTAANATVGATAASGKESGVLLAAGDTVVVAHTQAVDGSSAAGVATPYVFILQEPA